MDEAQLLKGILEGCVLSVIAREKTYGYQIIQILSDAGFEDLKEGTFYPVLTRLESRGCIICSREKSPLGPIRKYYSITDYGREQLDIFVDRYNKISQNADKILFCKEDFEK